MLETKSSNTIGRAMAILEFLARSDAPLTLAQISNGLDLNKASVHRTLKSLIDAGYIYKDERSASFQPSFKVCELSSQILDKLDFKYITRPDLEVLNRLTSETVHLVIRDWSQAVYIDKIESTHAIRTRSAVGERIYMHSTAAGKVLLSHLPWSKVEQIIAGVGLPERTPNTITDSEALKDELLLVYKQGWALDREENEIGIQSLAAPILNYRSNVVAAVSISYPALPAYQERLDMLIKQVCDTGKQISGHFGYIAESTTEAW